MSDKKYEFEIGESYAIFREFSAGEHDWELEREIRLD